jgi:hypothetical protein
MRRNLRRNAMRLIETVEHEMPSEVMYLEYLVLDPKEDHILLSAKSPLIGSFFKHHSNSTREDPNGLWSGKYWRFDQRKLNLPRDGSITFNNIGGPLFGEVNGATGGPRTNLSWMRHENLGEGMEIKIPGVCAMADFEDYLHCAADAIRNFYLQNLRKAVISMRMGERFTPEEVNHG